MKVLLVHPDDSLGQGEWSRHQWDLVVDLAFAGAASYANWSRQLKTRAFSIHNLARDGESYRWVKTLFARGHAQLVDRDGLDWWEILAMESYQDLHALFLLEQLRSEFSRDNLELVATRPHKIARMAQQLFRTGVRYLAHGEASALQKVGRTLRNVRNLRPAQVAEIAFDKWDPAYQFRRLWTKNTGAGVADPIVLVPSAYSNVTRSALAYAAQLPDRKFLLVTTRRNAVPQQALSNVRSSSLGAYVPRQETILDEATVLQEQWQNLLRRMTSESDEMACAAKAGAWEYVSDHLQHGIFLRETWKNVLQVEPIVGVLCGDDLNYHTRLPLMLAQKRGLNAVYCSHGALDGGFLFKSPSADSYLVKGEMEKDYLERTGAVAPEQIVIGAPGPSRLIDLREKSRDAIVFFSQPYEVEGGRAESFYREIVAPLCEAARLARRKVVVKLHPFESKRARQSLLDSVLSPEMRTACEIVDGLSPGKVMARAWCGITVDSSVAVECALRGIPFFLCGWLDHAGMGYLQQFGRFGVARVLEGPEDIARIPEMVAGFRPDPATLDRLWNAADSAQLEHIMFGARPVRLQSCAC